MAISQTDNRETQDELAQIKRKLVLRMFFAGLMIVALLGGLALFDYLSTRVEVDSGAPTFTEPVPVPKKNVTQPGTPVEPESEAKEEKPEESLPEASAPPVDKAAPRLEPPPRPEVAAQPVLPRASQPAARALVPARPPVPKAAPNIPTAPRVEPAARTQPQPSPPRLFSGYALQAGVFADPRRAEELHAKLTLAGIPSSIEARVQVGPFKNKDEAEAARLKMKELGVDAVLLMPRGQSR